MWPWSVEAPDSVFLNLNIDHNSIPQSFTESRAWIFQERFLSRRKLRFSRLETEWECGERRTQQWHHEKHFPKPTLSATKYALQSTSSFEVLCAWQEMVMSYSHCNLSVPTDKPIAIAGVASYFAPFLKCSYFADLWEWRM